MIDDKGYRENIGIIITNYRGELFWGKRIGQDSWQFPQGGVNEGESLEETLFRELKEEVGLEAKDVKIISQTKNWLYYKLPEKLIRHESKPLCIGQKQKWFLLKLISDYESIDLNCSKKPEFDDYKWVSYWYPLRYVVPFKREVYRRALCEFSVKKSRMYANNFEKNR